MPEVRGKAPERELEPILERRVAHVRAQLGAVAGPFERPPERAEPWDDAALGVVLRSLRLLPIPPTGSGLGSRFDPFVRTGSC